jgi:hypothetical protein
VPTEAEVVRRIFADTIAGRSQRAIARALNAEGVPSASGKPWTQPTIAVILANPLYAGQIRHAGETYDGAHEPILDREVWDAAEAIRQSKIRRKAGRHPRGAHLMVKGLLRCGRCGSAMLPRSGPDRYICRGRLEHGPDHCSRLSVPREAMDNALLAELTSRYLDLDAMRQRLIERHGSDLTVAEHALADAEHELTQADERLARIERDYIDGRLTVEQWARFEATLTGEREAAAAALSQARERVEMLRAGGSLGDAEAAILERLMDLKLAVADGIGSAPDLDAARTLLRQLFDEIHLIEIDGELQLLTLLREDALGPEGLPQPVTLPATLDNVGLPR